MPMIRKQSPVRRKHVSQASQGSHSSRGSAGESTLTGEPNNVALSSDFDSFSTVVTPNVRVGIKPLPLTCALVKSDRVLVEGLNALGYDCVLLPVTNARYKENCKDYFLQFKEDAQGADLNLLQVPYPKLDELNILTGSHVGSVIALLSSWVELDNENSLINEFSLQVILNEVSCAQYAGIGTLLIAPPTHLDNLQIYASNLDTILRRYPKLEISISLPICEDTKQDPVTGETLPPLDPFSTWDVWNSIRIQCNYNPNLSISLGSPKTNVPQTVVSRWLLEPVRFYLLSSYRFIPNSKNYPVLNKFNQLIIWKLIQRKALAPPTLLLHGVDRDDGNGNSVVVSSEGRTEGVAYSENSTAFITAESKQVRLGNLAYLEYLRYLVSVSYKNNQLLPLENFTLNSCLRMNLRPDQISSPDTLQSPLQPLAHNLDNNTYRVFEQDTAKYDAYGRAISGALMDLLSLDRFGHLKRSHSYGTSAYSTAALEAQKVQAEQTTQPHDTLKVMVVGPGRGPLIERLFKCIRLLNINIEAVHITAVEKNPNVMMYLNEKNRDHWNGAVNICNEDVRHWQPKSGSETGFHLVISELLGSFGCNELAPECLDSVVQWCDSQNCIFVPQEFSTYVAPVTCPSLYSKVSRLNKPCRFDRPFLPLWDEFDVLSSKYVKIWTFKQPKPASTPYNPLQNRHNSRQARVILKCHRKGTVHGLLGYFSAVLYKNVVISTCPTGSGPVPENLVSWLPFYLPIEMPIHLTDEQELSVLIRRVCRDERVWYEWSLEAFMYLLAPSDGSSAATTTASATTLTSDEPQIRVRTGVTRIHNADGVHFYMKLC